MHLSAIGMDFEKALQRVKSVSNVSPKHHLKLQNYYYVKCSQSPDDDIRKKRHCVLFVISRSFGFAVESVAYNLLSFIQISIRLLYVL
ncbi:hypothetical protein T02_15547 [Trichinella nativa]|uniref:Uncharacterized protein n=1 Tax=Trichinella nativa TaxID=6335 RepID=A0A0V1KUL2_9BILA|nr:hypothetical protein T02_4960 [Trichinella nativa]KRZ50526.1 hypothetical protein T02_15547 [Trichinella nativa]